MCEPAQVPVALRMARALKPEFSKSLSMICRKTSYTEDGMPTYLKKNGPSAEE